MNSLERVLTSLGHEEPDRVPYFLLLSLHGAKYLGMGLKDYFSDPSHLAEAQLGMQARFQHDCLYAFSYAPVEIEAWGGEVIFSDDGPPNSGPPFLENPAQIYGLKPPQPEEVACLSKNLEAIRMMKKNSGDDIPIIGVVMSPFSLPVMQLGFPAYLECIHEHYQEFHELMKVNIEFCQSWANAQLEAGATAICYFDPVSSPTCIEADTYRKLGLPIAKKTLSGINGPTATHFASGRALQVIDDVATSGTAALGVGCLENLKTLKDKAKGKISLIGNLNGIEMCRWDTKTARQKVKEAIHTAGKGGGFILSDSHGEIPWDVSFEILDAIRDTVHEFGVYPLNS